MKLIYLAHARLPTERAHGLQIMKMCQAFQRVLPDWEVELVVPLRGNHLQDDPFHYYGVERSFQIKALPAVDPLVHEKLWGQWAHRLGLATFLRQARRYVRQEKPAVVYTRELLIPLVLPRVILELHNMPRSGRWLFRRICQRAQRIAVLNSLLRAELLQLGVAADKIVVAADGVDLEEFTPPMEKTVARAALGLPSDRPIVMYVGTLYYYDWKGADVFLQAAADCSHDWQFVVVGGDPEEIVSAQKRYATQRVLFTGRQPHARIATFLQAADVLVLPNKKGDQMSERYTSPLKLFEYLAAGRPIVASDLPALREVLNENLAVLIPPNEPAELLGALAHLFSHPAHAQALAAAARQAAERYTWVARARQIVQQTFYVA